MTKEAATLISFKDLMQAKMEREQREADSGSSNIVLEEHLLPSKETKEIKETKNPENSEKLSVETESTTGEPLSENEKADSSDHEPTYLPARIDVYPVSPERDFAKLPNSVKRAVEDGKFPGSSLAIYIYLYSLTRAAIKPRRSIRVSKQNLKAGTNLRADKTLLRYIDHLEQIGFIKKTIFNGDHEGNEYEVFLPEESEEKQPTYLPTYQPTYLSNVVTQVPTKQRLVGRWVQVQENKDIYTSPKTSSLKTNTDDDFYASASATAHARVTETFFEMNKRFDSAVKKITGEGVSKTESEKWADLADLLILELEVAASRAEGISSVPAFLTEVLRRQFFASRQQQIAGKSSKTAAKASKAKTDTVGKSESDIYEIKPLGEKEREEALAQLREFADEDFLHDFKKWYTTDDWDWMMNKLAESDKN